MFKKLFSLFFQENTQKTELSEFNLKIDEVWAKVENGSYSNVNEFLTDLDNLSKLHEKTKFFSEELAYLELKRINLLYQATSLLIEPSGIKFSSYIFQRQKHGNIPVKAVFYKSVVKNTKELKKGIDLGAQEFFANPIKENEKFIVIETDNSLNYLLALAEIIVEKESGNTLLELNPKNIDAREAIL